MSVPGDRGDRLRLLRVRIGLSQKELALRAGVSVRTLRSLERGDVARPHAASLRRLAEALAVSPEHLAALLAGDEGVRPAGGDAGPDAPGVDAELRVAVLGPLSVRRGGTEVELPSAMQRTLLALLAIQPGRPVAAGDIVDLLWPHEPPRTCLQLVHTYVGQLRRVLEPGRGPRVPARLLRRSGVGYRLDLEPDQLDLHRYARSSSLARQAWADGAAQAACQLYAEAWACWRGPALAGADPGLRGHPAAVALAQQRVQTVLEWADAAFRIARYEQVAGPLHAVLAEEPLHEGLAARLMLALAGDGRQAAALGLFDTVRERLDAELGVEPGPELRSAHLRVLRGKLPVSAGPAPHPSAPSAPVASGSVAPVPAQLPGDIHAFTGREAHLDVLDTMLPAGGAEAGPVRVVVLAGMGGVGKTALAVHWARRARARFPDGQLHVGLRAGRDGGRVRPLEALAGFLHAFGVPVDRIPDDEAQAAAMYRSETAERRLLVLLDDAHDAEQVRPLLPTGPGSLALVTSRERMTGLVAREGARLVGLDPLAEHESVALLGQLLGPRRSAAHRAEVAELARLCAHLPLALRVAAANLAARPGHQVADFNARLLAGDRLGLLAADADPASALRTTFELSCANLPAAERRMFRLLGLAPGADLTVGAAAALADTTADAAQTALDRLTGRHLVHEHTPGRYGQHDLLRLHAASLGRAEESERQQDAALGRLAAHYRRRLAAGAGVLYPHLLHLPAADAPRAGTPGAPRSAQTPQAAPLFADSTAALHWLDAERSNLVALVQHLAAHPQQAAAWGLADLMTGYFLLRGHRIEWRTVAEAAHAAARRHGDAQARAATALGLGMCDAMTGRRESAVAHFTDAAALAGQAEWPACQAVALNNLAACHWAAGEVTGTVASLTRALELHRLSGRAAGEAVTLANIAVALVEGARRPGQAERDDVRQQALDLPDKALELHREVGDRRNEADTQRIKAEVHRDADRLDQALELAQGAVELARETQDARFHVGALTALATVHTRLGHGERGRALHQEALDLAGRTDEPRLLTEALLGMADTCVRLGHHDEARLHLHEARDLARQIRSRRLGEQAELLLRAASGEPDGDRPATPDDAARHRI